MIFQESLKRELGKSFSATLVVLTTIVMTMMMYRTLGFASKGTINPHEVFVIMGLSVLGHIPTLLTLSLFISVVSVLSRMLRDSEMVIWITSGQSIWRFIRPVLSFAWPLIVAIAGMALFVWPWTNDQMQHLRDKFESRGDLQRLIPGQFQESASGDRVFYVDKDSTAQDAKNVLIVSTKNGREAITSAKSAHVETALEAGVSRQYLVLNNGQRLERDLKATDDKPTLAWTQFDQLRTYVSDKSLPNNALLAKTLGSWTLVSQVSADHQAELAWRVSLALAAFNLVLVGLALIGFNPRTGRSTHLMVALLSFMIYYNFINIAQAWIGAGKINAVLAMALLHGSVLFIALAGLKLRNR